MSIIHAVLSRTALPRAVTASKCHLLSQSSLDMFARSFSKSCSISSSLCCAISHPSVLAAPPSGYDVPRRWRTRKGTVKRPYTKPLSFEYGGDIEWTPLVHFDKSEPKPGFENLPELEAADERVKKIFSMEFADGRERIQKEMECVVESLIENPADVKALENLIVRATVHLRKQIAHCLVFRKDKRSKVKLVEGIQRRKQYLKELRRIDRERFEWLLKELNLTYTPPSEYKWKPSKRQLRKRAAREACWAILNEKMKQLELQIEREKKDFAHFKVEELSRIEKELHELGFEMKPTIEETIENMNLGRDVFPKERRVKRRQAILEKKFELYGIHGRDRGKHARIKFT